MKLRLIFLTLFFGLKCESLKILMYQIAFSNTHMPFSGSIADILIDRGHVVDKIIIVYHSGVKNNGSTRLRNVYRIELPDEENLFMNSLHLKNPFTFKYFNRREPSGIESRRAFCEKMLEDKALISKLKAEKYDSFLVAPYDLCAFGLNHILQIPSVNAYSVLAQDGFVSLKFGTPAPPSYVPQVFNSNVQGKNKNFWERLRSFLYLVELEVDEEGLGSGEMNYLRKKIPNLPSVAEMFKTISYIFLNTNEILDAPQPITSRTKFIGGIAMKANDGKLTEEVEKILSNTNRGAIVFSFGSLIQTTSVPLEIKLDILKAFNAFPDYTFIWKVHEDDEIRLHFQNFTNVRPISWLPQIPLLNDDRVKIFITHMGMNSYLELSHAGKPVVGIPFFVDQFYNMDCALRNEIGVHLNKNNITTESMTEALKKILSNDKYAQNAKDISRLLKDRPVNIKEEMVKYIEYSAKHPRLPEFLQMDGAEMPLWKLYSLDVIAFLVAVTLIFVFALIFVLKNLANVIVKRSKTKKE